MRFALFIRKNSFLLFGIALLASCNKFENIPEIERGLNYFPLKVGSVIIYNVDSTQYSDFNNTVTTFQFQLKDSVYNKYIDAQGDEAYKIERYKKTAALDWIFQKIISRKITNNRAEEFLDNRRYVRLVFPLTLQSSWNGNLYNDLGEWRYKIKEENASLSLGTKILDSTLTTHYSEINALTEDILSETYAKNIGLVKKEVKAIEKVFNTNTIRRGYSYTMQMDCFR